MTDVNTHPSQLCCRRGKKLQKHYTVMVCNVDAATRAVFQPKLNSEHREARWWPVSELPPPQQQHPVVVGPAQAPMLCVGGDGRCALAVGSAEGR